MIESVRIGRLVVVELGELPGTNRFGEDGPAW